MLAIFNKELKSYFKSPIAYGFIAFFLVMFGFYFFMINIFYSEPDYTYVLANITTILLLGVPLLTMRLLSEEKRMKTDQLILTAPINTSGYVLGKFLAALTLFIIPTVITFLHPLALSTFGTLPWAKIIGAYFGMILLGATFISIGLYISALTENQVVSAIATFAVFMLMLYIDNFKQIAPADVTSSVIFLAILIIAIGAFIYNSTKNKIVAGLISVLGLASIAVGYFIKPTIYEGIIVNFLDWFSLINRYSSGFYMGILDFSTVVYYISFTTIFVFLTIQVVEKRRWS
ncbi:ABC transporter permease [Vallitalea okinawensis]|uniref:ABC transporter permease n=1 Tax=Vallitalea okinawensis TaxID=2078660 RepID=UPI000CFC71B5|nr:ABC transporter permease [Vallitalea okinawensis]